MREKYTKIELHIGYFNIISYNTVTVSLKTEVVIRIKASTTTPQFLSDNFWLSSQRLLVAIFPFFKFMKKMEWQLVLVTLSTLVIVAHGESKIYEMKGQHNQLTNTVNEMKKEFKVRTN